MFGEPVNYPFSAPAMGVALRSLTKSLENLKIDIHQSNVKQMTATALNNVGSLQAYIHLKKLAINLHILLGPEPASSVTRLVDVDRRGEVFVIIPGRMESLEVGT